MRPSQPQSSSVPRTFVRVHTENFQLISARLRNAWHLLHLSLSLSWPNLSCLLLLFCQMLILYQLFFGLSPCLLCLEIALEMASPFVVNVFLSCFSSKDFLLGSALAYPANCFSPSSQRFITDRSLLFKLLYFSSRLSTSEILLVLNEHNFMQNLCHVRST